MTTITQNKLKNLLAYDPDTGVFTYTKARPKVRVGGIAGHRHKGHGYIQIKINGQLYLAHRLAWLYVYGVWPVNQIDHINRDRTDNRFENLREATNAQNCQNRPVQHNSTSGVSGVNWNKTLGKWHARISLNGQRRHVGWYKTKDEATAARLIAEAELHPYRTAQ
jgi:hypothetical protein